MNLFDYIDYAAVNTKKPSKSDRILPATELNARGLLDAATNVPIAGDALSGVLAAYDAAKGDYGSAAVNALGVLPFVSAGMVKGTGKIADDISAKTKTRSQAPVGGTDETTNGYFYKGGQFLPSTEAEPGRWKIGKKWVTSGKELSAPGVYETQPTPFSKAIFPMINQYLDDATQGAAKFRNDIRFSDGSPFDVNVTFKPGVKGILGTDEYSLQTLLDEYNKGNRWINLNFDQPTLQTIKKVDGYADPRLLGLIGGGGLLGLGAYKANQE